MGQIKSPMRMNDCLRAMYAMGIEYKIRLHYMERTETAEVGRLTQEQIEDELASGIVMKYTNKDLREDILYAIANSRGFDVYDINQFTELLYEDFKNILGRTETGRFKDIMRADRTAKFFTLETMGVYRPVDPSQPILSNTRLNEISRELYREEQNLRGAQGGPIHQAIITKNVDYQMRNDYNAAFVGLRVISFKPNWEMIDSTDIQDTLILQYWNETTQDICNFYGIDINQLDSKESYKNVMEMVAIQADACGVDDLKKEDLHVIATTIQIYIDFRLRITEIWQKEIDKGNNPVRDLFYSRL